VTLPFLRALVACRRGAPGGRQAHRRVGDALDAPPWFSYSAIVNGDDTWTALAADGQRRPAPSPFDEAASRGRALDGAYPRRLLARPPRLVAPARALRGAYDATGR